MFICFASPDSTGYLGKERATGPGTWQAGNKCLPNSRILWGGAHLVLGRKCIQMSSCSVLKNNGLLPYCLSSYLGQRTNSTMKPKTWLREEQMGVMTMGALQRKKEEQRVVSRVFTCKARPGVSASAVIQRKGKTYNPRYCSEWENPVIVEKGLPMYISSF